MAKKPSHVIRTQDQILHERLQNMLREMQHGGKPVGIQGDTSTFKVEYATGMVLDVFVQGDYEDTSLAFRIRHPKDEWVRLEEEDNDDGKTITSE